MQHFDRRIAEGKDGVGREGHQDTAKRGMAGGQGFGIGGDRCHRIEQCKGREIESRSCEQLYDEMGRISIGAEINYCFKVMGRVLFGRSVGWKIEASPLVLRNGRPQTIGEGRDLHDTRIDAAFYTNKVIAIWGPVYGVVSLYAPAQI